MSLSNVIQYCNREGYDTTVRVTIALILIMSLLPKTKTHSIHQVYRQRAYLSTGIHGDSVELCKPTNLTQPERKEGQR